uniref:Uncharacterized protein n=1 Tax=Nelumbo nucifera TaxID=4432 RepID=A0A822YLZ6_NELNU|nr:TPA_asm: hypothetical protein HUJ06_010876 [Nelumbo nucifera]
MTTKVMMIKGQTALLLMTIDKARKKEMRKGIDLAATLERIEKNFIITDSTLPDNPIVRLQFSDP